MSCSRKRSAGRSAFGSNSVDVHGLDFGGFPTYQRLLECHGMCNAQACTWRIRCLNLQCIYSASTPVQPAKLVVCRQHWDHWQCVRTQGPSTRDVMRPLLDRGMGRRGSSGLARCHLASGPRLLQASPRANPDSQVFAHGPPIYSARTLSHRPTTLGTTAILPPAPQ